MDIEPEEKERNPLKKKTLFLGLLLEFSAHGTH